MSPLDALVIAMHQKHSQFYDASQIFSILCNRDKKIKEIRPSTKNGDSFIKRKKNQTIKRKINRKSCSLDILAKPFIGRKMAIVLYLKQAQRHFEMCCSLLSDTQKRHFPLTRTMGPEKWNLNVPGFITLDYFISNLLQSLMRVILVVLKCSFVQLQHNLKPVPCLKLVLYYAEMQKVQIEK